MAQPANQETIQGQMYAIKEALNLTRDADSEPFWKQTLIPQMKEANSQLHSDSNCNHSLNIMCHAHKRNATEMTKEWLK